MMSSSVSASYFGGGTGRKGGVWREACVESRQAMNGSAASITLSERTSEEAREGIA